MNFLARRRARRLHFIGIGGIGMSGIAEVLHNQGITVSGSDVAENDTVLRLRSLGIKITQGHRADNVSGAEVVIVSSAIRADNPELVAARQARIPVIPRAEMLGELMRGKTGIAVAGSHGKTTTTSMLATIFTKAGLDPTLVIGGKVDSLGGNAKLGSGEWVIAEADESDGSFLHLPTMAAIITNIDNDHLDHYANQDAIDRAFVDFVAHLPFFGFAVVCADDVGVKRIREQMIKPVVTYGFDASADYVISDWSQDHLGSRYRLSHRGRELGQIRLQLVGRHNALNSAAAAVMALELDVPFREVAAGLEGFVGVRRRFDVLWENSARKRILVEDYGHHPTEIRATLDAARARWSGKIRCIFQPHRYTRTQTCWDSFLTCFDGADSLWVAPIYSAGEPPIPGVTTEALVKEIRSRALDAAGVVALETLDEIESRVLGEWRDGDLFLIFGAGSITRVAGSLARQLAENGIGPA